MTLSDWIALTRQFLSSLSEFLFVLAVAALISGGAFLFMCRSHP